MELDRKMKEREQQRRQRAAEAAIKVKPQFKKNKKLQYIKKESWVSVLGEKQVKEESGWYSCVRSNCVFVLCFRFPLPPRSVSSLMREFF